MIARKLLDIELGIGQQCSYEAALLHDIGYKGYRARRVKLNGMNPDFCMRLAVWSVDGKCYCERHAGKLALEYMQQ